MLDEASFTTKMAVHTRTTAFAALGCAALLHTCSPQTFIRPDVAATPSLPEHGHGLVEGTIMLDDASSTTKIAVHTGTTASTALGCVALLDTCSRQTSIRPDVFENFISAGAATVHCE